MINVYQAVTKELKRLQQLGVDIGKSIKYCSDNVVELNEYYPDMSIEEVANHIIVLAKLDLDLEN